MVTPKDIRNEKYLHDEHMPVPLPQGLEIQGSKGKLQFTSENPSLQKQKYLPSLY